MRASLFMLLAIVLAACSAPVVAPSGTSVHPTSIATVRLVVHRSATCSCCHLHLTHLRDAGWQVDDIIDVDNTATKDRIGVPADARSCHTTICGRYWVGGRVTSAVIERPLREQPDLDGTSRRRHARRRPGDERPSPTLEIVGVKDGQTIGVFAVGA